MPHPVIYSHSDGQFVVLDLPASIAWAQACPSRHLLSTPACSEPYHTPEPRGDKRIEFEEKLPPSERELGVSIESSLRVALEEVRPKLDGLKWCLPRVCSNRDLCTVGFKYNKHNVFGVQAGRQPPLILSSADNCIDSLGVIHGTVVHNPHSFPVDLVITIHGRFYVPPNSTFINSSIEEGLDCFKEAIRTLVPVTDKTDTARITFDLVLLDPPWSNRSVRHSRSYRSTENQSSDPFVQVLPILQQYLANNAYVAIWITNKARIRQQVVDAFRSLSLSMHEEWIWLKITSKGEAITPLDGVWRKSYESLLLFSTQIPPRVVRRRSLFAVPDVHSRKPSLKFLFEPLLSPGYTALELFARSLTSGWWSWGDEVLKFQHETCWASSVDA